MSDTLTAPAAPSATAPVSLTPRAVEAVQQIMAAKDLPDGYALRVGVKGGGCSGLSYVLGFDKRRDHDAAFDLDGLTVFMDKRQGLYLLGTVVDFHDGLDARGFTFDNPNATQTCGCGSSFSA